MNRKKALAYIKSQSMTIIKELLHQRLDPLHISEYGLECVESVVLDELILMSTEAPYWGALTQAADDPDFANVVTFTLTDMQTVAIDKVCTALYGNWLPEKVQTNG